jgi:hypothetical protein
VIGRWTVINLVLVAIVALLGIQIGRTWMRTVPPLRAPAAGPAEPASRHETKVKPAAARGDKADEDVALITSMDLFDVSRQAVGAAAETVAPVEVPPPTGVDVVGIRLIAGDQEAFIRDASQQNAQRRVRTGDEVAGYTVQTIRPTSVELVNPTGQSVTLWLQLSPSGGAKPGTPQAAGVRRIPVPVPAVPAPAAAGRAVAAQPSPVRPPTPDPAALRQQRRLEARRQRSGVPPAVQQRLDRLRNGKGA